MDKYELDDDACVLTSYTLSRHTSTPSNFSYPLYSLHHKSRVKDLYGQAVIDKLCLLTEVEIPPYTKLLGLNPNDLRKGVSKLEGWEVKSEGLESYLSGSTFFKFKTSKGKNIVVGVCTEFRRSNGDEDPPPVKYLIYFNPSHWESYEEMCAEIREFLGPDAWKNHRIARIDCALKLDSRRFPISLLWQTGSSSLKRIVRSWVSGMLTGYVLGGHPQRYEFYDEDAKNLAFLAKQRRLFKTKIYWAKKRKQRFDHLERELEIVIKKIKNYQNVFITKFEVQLYENKVPKELRRVQDLPRIDAFTPFPNLTFRNTYLFEPELTQDERKKMLKLYFDCQQDGYHNVARRLNKETGNFNRDFIESGKLRVLRVGEEKKSFKSFLNQNFQKSIRKFLGETSKPEVGHKPTGVRKLLSEEASAHL